MRLGSLVLCGSAVAWSVFASAEPPRDGRHDFDFEIGSWKTRLRRLTRPLTGSGTWVEYEGTTVVRPVWGGHANLVELDVQGPRAASKASRCASTIPSSVRGASTSRASEAGR